MSGGLYGGIRFSKGAPASIITPIQVPETQTAVQQPNAEVEAPGKVDEAAPAETAPVEKTPAGISLSILGKV